MPAAAVASLWWRPAIAARGLWPAAISKPHTSPAAGPRIPCASRQRNPHPPATAGRQKGEEAHRSLPDVKSGFKLCPVVYHQSA